MFSSNKISQHNLNSNIPHRPRIAQALHDTTTLSHHPYILCHFANYAHHKTLYMHFAYYICIEWTRYSALLTPQSYTHKCWPISAMFSSNKISQHTLKLQHTTQTQHCSSTAQFLHALKADHICHAQYSNYIAATHNITHSPSKRTTHPPLPTPLHKNTNHICASGGKMAQDVGMVWKCCGIIPI